MMHKMANTKYNHSMDYSKRDTNHNGDSSVQWRNDPILKSVEKDMTSYKANMMKMKGGSY